MALDSDAIHWGKSGLTADLSDYKIESQKDYRPKTGQYKQFKLSLEGYYDRYTKKTVNPSCKVKPLDRQQYEMPHHTRHDL